MGVNVTLNDNSKVDHLNLFSLNMKIKTNKKMFPGITKCILKYLSDINPSKVFLVPVLGDYSKVSLTQCFVLVVLL